MAPRFSAALVIAVCVGLAAGSELRGAETETTIRGEIRGTDELKRLVIHIDGPIAAGTVDRVAAVLAEPQARVATRTLVTLRSEGGTWAEGVALARLFRAHHVGTVVPEDAQCLSACAIAFLGGAMEDPVEGTVAARAMGATSRLGFHAPYLTLRNRMFLITDVERAYAQAVESMLLIFSLADDLEVDTKLLTALLVSGEDTFEFVDSVDEAGRLGIYVSGAASPARPSTEQIRTYCTNAFDWKRGPGGTARPPLAPGEARAALANAPVLHERVATAEATGPAWMRTILPVSVDARGIYDWCVFDTRLEEGSQDEISLDAGRPEPYRCRGFVRARRAEDVAARMRDAPAGWRVAERDCHFPTAADPRAARPDPRASASLAFRAAYTALPDLASRP